MQLTGTLSAQRICSLATYKRSVNQPLFTSILRFIVEELDGTATPEAMATFAGAALNTVMWRNLLYRLTTQGYFQRLDGSSASFRLTELGTDCAHNETFFETREGMVEILITGSQPGFFPHRVVEVREVSDSQKETSESKRGVANIAKWIPLQTDLNLKGSTYRFERFERVVETVEKVELNIQLSPTPDHVNVTAGDLSFETSSYNVTSLEQRLLKHQFGQQYDSGNNLVRTEFQSNDLRFARPVTVSNYDLDGLPLHPIKLPEVNFNAATPTDAEQWRTALLHRMMSDYLFELSDFTAAEERARTPFAALHRLPIWELNDYRTTLTQTADDNFYALAKINAPQTLTF